MLNDHPLNEYTFIKNCEEKYRPKLSLAYLSEDLEEELNMLLIIKDITPKYSESGKLITLKTEPRENNTKGFVGRVKVDNVPAYVDTLRNTLLHIAQEIEDTMRQHPIIVKHFLKAVGRHLTHYPNHIITDYDGVIVRHPFFRDITSF
ncbi:MAG: hypothetical protein HQL06_08750 [Nitrospirae bacterium]|nr:hypothetical protein [Nitrospirota bacterium]